MRPGNAEDRRGMHRTRGKLQREKLYRLGNAVGVILQCRTICKQPTRQTCALLCLRFLKY